MAERELRLSIRRHAPLVTRIDRQEFPASASGEHGERIEVIEQEDVAAVLEVLADGTLSIRLFGDHRRSPLKSALVRLEAPHGLADPSTDARLNDAGRAVLAVPARSPMRDDSGCYLIVTIPVTDQ